MHKLIYIFAVSFVLAMVFPLPQDAKAQSIDREDLTVGFMHAPIMAMGGACRSYCTDNSAILWNPAAIALQRGTKVAFNYQTSGYRSSDVLSGSISDNKTGQFAFGFSFDRDDLSLQSIDSSLTQYTIAGAIPISNLFYAGVSFKYFDIGIDSPLLSGDQGFTGDIGLLARPIPQLSLAFTVNNLFDGNETPNVPLIFAGAASLNIEETGTISFEVVFDESTENPDNVNFNFGGEAKLKDGVYFRTGFGWDRVRDNPFLGTGIVLDAPRALLAFTYAHRFESDDETFALTFEFRF